MTQNDCMDSNREDVKLKDMRMAPDKVGGAVVGTDAAEGGGGDPSLSPPHPVALISSSAALHLMKEGMVGGGGGGVPPPSENDDDLTSLSWLLQDKNILKGINLRTAAVGVQESPTSDYVEDSASERGEDGEVDGDGEGEGDSSCSSVNSGSPVPPPSSVGGGGGGGGGGGVANKNKHPHHIPYDPKVHVTSKPPYSFSCLIFMAIEDSSAKALPVKEIYAWILDHFPYYKNAPTGWKNSVRHNLSLNKCFCKVEKAPNLGKGSLWMVDPVYRPNLVQALKKAPYHPYAIMGTGSDGSTPTRNSQQPDSYSPGDQSPDDVTAAPSPTHGAVDLRSNSRLLPDPDLFPYLSRRLLAAAAMAAVSGDHHQGHHFAAGDDVMEDDSSSPLDDVDAAAAMLALKHGPRVRMSIEQRKDEYHKQMTAVNLTTSKGKKKSKEEEETDVLITSCPSEDHTYSVEHTQALHTEMYTYRFNNNNGATVLKHEPTSPDEAFQEGSDSNSSWAVRAANGHQSRDVEEERKIAEGADALLNLAGIATTPTTTTTSLRRTRTSTSTLAHSVVKRPRLDDEEEEHHRVVMIKEEPVIKEEVEERVPFRPRLLRKSPLKRDLKSERREERKEREKMAAMKVLDYAQAIMDSMNETNNNNNSPMTSAEPVGDEKSIKNSDVSTLKNSDDDKVGSATKSVVEKQALTIKPAGGKVRRKSLLTPVKHVAKVKR